MTKEQLIQLHKIYNTLLTIETKGESTLIMADCIRALGVFAKDISIINETKGDEGDGEQ